MTITEHIIHVLEDNCLTTDAIARRVNATEADTAMLCKALARQGRIFLASYGWNDRLAWADADWADDMLADRHDEPWYMSARDRQYELSAR